MSRSRLVVSALFVLAVSTAASAQQAPSRFPVALSARTDRLEFASATPATGSLDAQVDAQFTELHKQFPHSRIVKIRAFAMAEDLPNVEEAIQRVTAKDGGALPVVSVVGVAGFPSAGQRVQLEETLESTTATAPHGLGFLAGLASPTGARTIAGLARVARESGVLAADVRRISCFYESAPQVESAKTSAQATFPNASLTLVQSRRADDGALIECEAVGVLGRPENPDVRYYNLLTGPPSPNYSHASLVSTPRLVFTSGIVAEGADEPAMARALSRLESAAAAHGTHLSDAVMSDNYWLSDAARDALRASRTRFFGSTVPAATGVTFTSLVNPNASASIELVIAADRGRIDTVDVAPGSPSSDGRYLTSHAAELTQTTTRNGAVVASHRFRMTKRVAMAADGAPSFEIDMHGEGADTAATSHIVLDHRTLSLLRREDRDSAGSRLELETHGRDVRYSTRTAAGMTSHEFTLGSPAFSGAFMDAAANSVDLRMGLMLRIPAFSLAPGSAGEIVGHVFRVVARDTVRVDGRAVPAWVVEESPHDSVPAQRVWLIREPPFFPLSIVYLRDGSVQRSEQRLVKPD